MKTKRRIPRLFCRIIGCNKNSTITENYTALKIVNGPPAFLLQENDRIATAVESLITMPESGSPITPYLQPIHTEYNTGEEVRRHTALLIIS